MRRSGPFFPPPQAPVWKTVEARKGQACCWGLLLGHLELAQESTSGNTQGTCYWSWLPRAAKPPVTICLDFCLASYQLLEQESKDLSGEHSSRTQNKP